MKTVALSELVDKHGSPLFISRSLVCNSDLMIKIVCSKEEFMQASELASCLASFASYSSQCVYKPSARTYRRAWTFAGREHYSKFDWAIEIVCEIDLELYSLAQQLGVYCQK